MMPPWAIYDLPDRDPRGFAAVTVVAGGLREEVQRAFILHRFDRHLGGAARGVQRGIRSLGHTWCRAGTRPSSPVSWRAGSTPPGHRRRGVRRGSPLVVELGEVGGEGRGRPRPGSLSPVSSLPRDSADTPSRRWMRQVQADGRAPARERPTAVEALVPGSRHPRPRPSSAPGNSCPPFDLERR